HAYASFSAKLAAVAEHVIFFFRTFGTVLSNLVAGGLVALTLSDELSGIGVQVGYRRGPDGLRCDFSIGLGNGIGFGNAFLWFEADFLFKLVVFLFVLLVADALQAGRRDNLRPQDGLA